MTATSDEAKVEAALFRRLSTLVTDPVTAINWPDDEDFVEPVDSDGKLLPYLKVAVVPVDPGFLTLAGILKRHRGLLQIMVVTRKGARATLPKNIGGQIVSHFIRQVLYEDTIKVQIVGQPYVSNSFKGDTKTETPVTINYLAFT